MNAPLRQGDIYCVSKGWENLCKIHEVLIFELLIAKYKHKLNCHFSNLSNFLINFWLKIIFYTETKSFLKGNHKIKRRSSISTVFSENQFQSEDKKNINFPCEISYFDRKSCFCTYNRIFISSFLTRKYTTRLSYFSV